MGKKERERREGDNSHTRGQYNHLHENTLVSGGNCRLSWVPGTSMWGQEGWDTRVERAAGPSNKACSLLWKQRFFKHDPQNTGCIEMIYWKRFQEQVSLGNTVYMYLFRYLVISKLKFNSSQKSYSEEIYLFLDKWCFPNLFDHGKHPSLPTGEGI